ncbi:peptidase domain-containing ABC transporter [Zoogloea sp.]|uniref:peptidase domain-containing ABC transporter n=1 Tax=Zoogloea sp. TaxID=49181 RepID=UPI0035AE2C1D
MSDASFSAPAWQSALQCLLALARHHRIETSLSQLENLIPGTPEPGEATHRRVLALAEAVGLKAGLRQPDLADVPGLGGVLPALVCLKNGNYVILLGVKEAEPAAEPGAKAGAGPRMAVMDPLSDPPNSIFWVEEGAFAEAWSGQLILIRREYGVLDEQQPFGLRWFIPELFRQRDFLRDVALAALVLHGLGLAMPVFMQLVIDKVLAHQGYSTLYVLTAGVLLALVFEGVFGYLRQFYMLHATNRIDMRLARTSFAHLLRLPITFFDSGSAGVITRHMQQVEKVRQFLTGRLFTTVLDATVLLIFLPILFFYSGWLALLVLGFTAAIAAVVFAMVPVFRQRLQALYKAEAERQALLVETIQGMRTVKALAIEPLRRQTWEERSAQAIQLHFRVGQISMGAHTAMSFLEKAMMVCVIAVGAHQVFDQQLSVGALIAFQMLAGRVVTPLVQMVSLVHEYQETALSVRMLGEIMNHPVEGMRQSGGLEPELQGRIEFDGVSFRYGPQLAPSVDKLTFTLPAGKVLGVVGRSGSGKTTLTRLIQGLYPPQEGVIRFDGVDAREIDLAHLRRQIGVVLQDSFLFKGTVRDNIAVTHPSAPLEDVVEAARLAGADEFIERLPQGYATPLDENAANLSGGQKQRLAIARALLGKPRILILDEAASALDPESEAIFLANLKSLAQGRTVIIVSHRLSALVRADAIMVMQRGGIVDAGRHDELLQRCQIYAHLWQQQTQHL